MDHTLQMYMTFLQCVSACECLHWRHMKRLNHFIWIWFLTSMITFDNLNVMFSKMQNHTLHTNVAFHQCIYNCEFSGRMFVNDMNMVFYQCVLTFKIMPVKRLNQCVCLHVFVIWNFLQMLNHRLYRNNLFHQHKFVWFFHLNSL